MGVAETATGLLAATAGFAATECDGTSNPLESLYSMRYSG